MSQKVKLVEKKPALVNFNNGQLPPQALDLEKMVLGIILSIPQSITVVVDLLIPESFYDRRHQLVYAAAKKLFENFNPIDYATVAQELITDGSLDEAGGPAYLIELTKHARQDSNFEHHARIIQQKAIARGLIQVSSETIRDAFNPEYDPFDLIETTEKRVFAVTQQGWKKPIQSPSDIGMKVLKQIEEARSKPDGLTGVPSGFTDLDRLTSGWQPSDLIIVAARPGMGKTSFVLSMATHIAAEFKKGLAIFSLEMDSTQLMKKVYSQSSGIYGSKLRSGKMEDHEWQKLHTTIEQMSDVPIFIDDTPGINIFEVRAKCRRLKMQHDIQMVIIDYLQLMTGTGNNNKGNREQEISQISRGLKALAKELGVPVIALSQLSRAVETRGGAKRPQLSDLRESGAIEQDADIVSFIYRPEYYNILEDESGQSLKGVAEIIIAKHRNGALDTVLLNFNPNTASFSDIGDPNFDDFSEDLPPPPKSVLIAPPKRNNDDDIPF